MGLISPLSWHRIIKVEFSGVEPPSDFSNPTYRQFNGLIFRCCWKVNLRGVIPGCKFACAQFLRQDLDQAGHRELITTVASTAGLKGIAAGAYSAPSQSLV